MTTEPFPAGGGGCCKPARQMHFGNNLLKTDLNSGLWVAVYTANSDPISDVHYLVCLPEILIDTKFKTWKKFR